MPPVSTTLRLAIVVVLCLLSAVAADSYGCDIRDTLKIGGVTIPKGSYAETLGILDIYLSRCDKNYFDLLNLAK